jgi:Helix-turn-helix domain
MTEQEYVTIQEAARRYGVSDKKLQRAIRAKKLPASYPQPNRCAIAVSDLEHFLHGQVSGHATEPVEQQVAELERRIQQLECQVATLLSQQGTPKSARGAMARERTTGSLPKQFVSLLAFAQHHNVAENKVLAHVDINLLPVKQGKWIDADGTVVTLALDAKGRQAFYQLYRGVAPFVPCDQCPHGYLDTV